VWCREHGVELRAAAEGINSAGGYVVPGSLSAAIIRLRDTYGVARRECRVRPMSSDTVVVPKSVGGPSTYYVSENGSITTSDSEWSAITLTARKIAAMTRISSEIAEDAVIAMADDTAEQMGLAFAQAEDEALFQGDGTSTYGGIVGLREKFIENWGGASAYAGAVEAAADHDLYSELTAADLSNTMAALPEFAYRGNNVKWYCSRTAWGSVFQRLIQAASGATADDMARGYSMSYMGFPVILSPAMPTVTTDLSDKVMILFGDMRMATSFGDRRGITVKVDESRYLEYDQIAVRATERYDINVHDIGDSSTAGPMVALIGH